MHRSICFDPLSRLQNAPFSRRVVQSSELEDTLVRVLVGPKLCARRCEGKQRIRLYFPLKVAHSFARYKMAIHNFVRSEIVQKELGDAGPDDFAGGRVADAVAAAGGGDDFDIFTVRDQIVDE